MVRIVVMFVAGFLLIAMGAMRLSYPTLNYLVIAGNFLTGFGLLLFAWLLKRTGKGNLVGAAMFLIGCILTVIGNFYGFSG